MSTPAGLAAHVKHVFESSRQREVLVRMAEAIELLNERCACVNLLPATLADLTPDDDGIDTVEFEEDDQESPLS